jgi:hypothetical protein
MSRPKRDGTKAAPPNKRKLTDLFVRKAKPAAVPLCVWDAHLPGLVLRIQPSGHKSFKFVYSFRGRSRWFNIGQVGLTDARAMAEELRVEVTRGKDPAAERKAERGVGTFADLARRYHDQYASRETRSAAASRRIVENYLGAWAGLDARTITRADVRALKAKLSATPIMANRVLATASMIFNWAIGEDIIAGDNPCRGVKHYEEKARERVLSDSELPLFWAAFDGAGLVKSSALKVILLTGQRPGEVAHMRREHLRDGWWELPGEPVAALGLGPRAPRTRSRTGCGSPGRCGASWPSSTRMPPRPDWYSPGSHASPPRCRPLAASSARSAPRPTTCGEPSRPPSPAWGLAATR